MRASFSFPVGLLLFLLVVKQHECFSVYNVENCLSSSSNRYPLSNHIITKASLHRVGGVKTKRDGPIILLSTSSATSTAFDNEGMEDAIRKEFSVGCEGLDKDVARLFRPGIENVLSYQPVAQKAWIRRVRVARGQDVDFTPFNEQEVTPQGSPSSSYETPKSIATSEKVVTALERVKAYFSGNTDGLTIKEKLAKMGLSVALSYSFVSNLAGCSSVVLTWYIFCKKVSVALCLRVWSNLSLSPCTNWAHFYISPVLLACLYRRVFHPWQRVNGSPL